MSEVLLLLHSQPQDARHAVVTRDPPNMQVPRQNYIEDTRKEAEN
jgi:hypothetical protein